MKKTVKKQTLVIRRDKWLRGEGSDKSALLRSKDNKMCCLGFYAGVCRVTRAAMKDQSSPGHLFSLPQKMSWLVENKAPGETYQNDSDVCESLMTINDDEKTTDKQKEQKIKQIFAKQGVTVKFV